MSRPRLRSAALVAALVALVALVSSAAAGAGVPVEPPNTSPCPPGQGPTTISKRASLAEAAKLGAVKLTSKGGFNGDVVGVDATWKPSKAPVTVQIDVEFTTYPGGPSAAQVEAAIESKLPPRTASNGTAVKFDIVARGRAEGAPASPCFHQAKLSKSADLRGEAGGEGDPLEMPLSGEWPSGRGPTGDRQIWTHEALHLAGLEDQYSSFFKTKGGKLIPIPDEVDIDDPAELKEWAESKGLDVTKGKAGTKAKPGHENDIMGDVFKGGEKLQQAAVDRFAEEGANKLTIEAKPGDLLLNKDPGSQNIAVGAPVELTTEPDKPAHIDGVVGYCIDLGRHAPAAGQGFDVLGPAGAQPLPAMQYLQRVLDIAATLQPEALKATPDAQEAVWRITDDSPTTDGLAILAAAGVPDQTFAAPHIVDPNTASPETAAVSTTGVLPPAAPVPYLSGLKLSPGSVPAGEPRTIKATVSVDAAGDKVRFELQHRDHGAWKRVARLSARKVRAGTSKVTLKLPALHAGAARVVAIGAAASAVAPLRVR